MTKGVSTVRMALFAVCFVALFGCGSAAGSAAPSVVPPESSAAGAPATLSPAAPPEAGATPGAETGAAAPTATTPGDAAGAPSSSGGFAGRWVELGRLGTGGRMQRVSRVAALPDGTLLVTGHGGLGPHMASALVLDPATGAWLDSEVHVGASDATAVLRDRLFVAGGSGWRIWSNGAGGGWSAIVGAGAPWDPIGVAAAAIRDGSAILVAGGCNGETALRSAVIYETRPGADAVRSARTSLVYPRAGAAAVALSGGRVLVVGASPDAAHCRNDRATEAAWTAEWWVPTSGRFALAGTIPRPGRATLEAAGLTMPAGRPQVRDPGRLLALPGGDALLLGRMETWAGLTGDAIHITRSFRFHGADRTWTEIGVASIVAGGSPRRGVTRSGAAAASLADGRVLVAGGEVVTSLLSSGTRWADLYDPETDAWLPLPPLPEAIASGAAIGFADGTAIVVGATGTGYYSVEPHELVAFGLIPAGAPGSGPGAARPSPDCPGAFLPSVVARLGTQARLDCFGSRDQIFLARVVIDGDADADYLDAEAPDMFEHVRRASPDEPGYGPPVFLTDPVPTLASTSNALPLVVARPSIAEALPPAESRVTVTGHFDDPASVDCEPDAFGLLTAEEAVLRCRGRFVVTAIEPIR